MQDVSSRIVSPEVSSGIPDQVPLELQHAHFLYEK